MAGKDLTKIGTGPFDEAIVRGFSERRSAEEISNSEPINGLLTPAQCLARLNQLIKSKDVLDVRDALSLALDDVYWLRTRLRKQLDESDWIAHDQANVYLKTIDAITGRLEKVQAGMSDHMLRFNQRRAEEMIQALGYIMSQVTTGLEQLGIDRAEIDEIVLEAIPESIPEVE